MKIDDLGLPQVNGSTDLQDSAALAGIMTVFGWPQKVDLREYINWKNGKRIYVRHPAEDKGYDFSRDQFICLSAGIRAMGHVGNFFVNTELITGRDILSPSVRGHVARCQGGNSTWFQDLWFWADLWFSANYKPLEELNQLFCMMMIADSKFIKWYCQANPQWEKAIKDYWCENSGAWRNEPELADLMISKIRGKL